MKFVRVKKNVKILLSLVIAICTLMSVCACSSEDSIDFKAAEKVAEKYIKADYDGDEKEYVSLMSQAAKEMDMHMKDCATEKILIQYYKEHLLPYKEIAKKSDISGAKYSTTVVDSYPFVVEDYSDQNINDKYILGKTACVVRVEVKTTGREFFQKVEDIDNYDVYIVKEDNEWLVAYCDMD